MSANHNHAHHHEVQGKNLVVTIFLNLAISVAQAVGGILSGSLALLSDALHNFSDVLSLLFSYIAHKLSKKKATLNHTFGYKRAEIIAAFINAITLIIVAIYLGYEAVLRFYHPQEIKFCLVILLSILAIAFNGFSLLLLKKDAEKNINMKSAYLHLLTDATASFAVLIGGLVMKFFGWFWVDSFLTICISIYLVYVGYDLLKESTKMLMLFSPENIDVSLLISTVHKIPKVKKLHHIHIWKLNDNEIHLEAHLDLSDDIKMSEFNEILHQIEELLFHKFNINHSTIQPEFDKIETSKATIVQD